jgi:hypothetical protein
MSNKNDSRRVSRQATFDSRRTLGPVATLLLRSLVARDRSLEELTVLHTGARRALRSLIDRGLVLERKNENGVRFGLSAGARRSLAASLRATRAPSGTAVVVTGVPTRDTRRSKRTSTFKK